MDQPTLAHITDLLTQAGAAHGDYETRELNGVYDQNWPIWYAEWIIAHGLNDLLPTRLNADELSRLLFDINERHKASNTGESWAAYTAAALLA